MSVSSSRLLLLAAAAVAAVAVLLRLRSSAPAARPHTSTPEAPFAPFVAWMAAGGIIHRGTVLRELAVRVLHFAYHITADPPILAHLCCQPGNRDVFATKTFDKDEIVMIVPHQMVISDALSPSMLYSTTPPQTIHDSLARTDPVVAQYSARYPSADWVSIIAGYLVLHRTDPRWEPYLSFLPLNHSTPLYWTEEELSVIDGTDLREDLVPMKKEIQTEWIRWSAYFPAQATYDEFLWAWHVVMSRSVIYKTGVFPYISQSHTFKHRVWILPVGDLTNKAVMIPMVDAANHHTPDKAKVKIEYSKSLQAVTMTATKTINPSEPIGVTYGSESTYKSLKYMGFTVPNNDATEDCRVQLLRQEGDLTPRDKKWCLFQTHKLEKTISDCHMGAPGKKETFVRVKNLVQTKLQKYLTSITEDNKILRNFKSGNLENASVNFINGVRERR
ncbi:hypothetical protein HDU82_002880, partial [Entophlyctis luteolus]